MHTTKGKKYYTTTQKVTKTDLLFRNWRQGFSLQFSLYWEHKLDMFVATSFSAARLVDLLYFSISWELTPSASSEIAVTVSLNNE